MTLRLPLLCLALTSACLAPVGVGGDDAGHCGPGTCGGCCDADGVCRGGALDVQCGHGGSACGGCPGLGACQGGACVATARCVLPGSVEWAAVAIGDSAVRTLALTNPSASAVVATIGDVLSASGDDAAFSFSTLARTVTIPAHTTHAVELRFVPTAEKDYLARVVVQLADGCPEQVVGLTGTGVRAVLTWAPNPLDCGYLPPALERRFDVTFSNAGLKPVKLSNLKTTGAEFRVSPAPVTVPGKGTAKVGVTVKPTGLGPKTGRLDFESDLPKQLGGTVGLKCYGGGPDLDAAPELELGSLAYFAGVQTPMTTRLTVRNVGTAPVPPDPKANLHLAQVPWVVRVRPNVPGNTATVGELCVGAFVGGVCLNVPAAGTYDPAIGLEASGAKAVLEVPLRVTPTSVGWKEWEVVVFSDDPDEPEFLVVVRAQAVVVPPCDLEVLPAALGFGLVPAGSARDLSVVVKNKGTDVCLLSAPELAPGADPGFSVAGAQGGSLLLQPGTSRATTVRFAPKGTPPPGPTAVNGTLRFSVSNPTKPEVGLPLTAMVGPACLSIVPNRFDFGTIQKSCNSATRTFLLYDTCAQPLEVSSAALVQPGAEFIAVNTAGLAPGTMITAGSAPATFSLKYAPSGEGADSASFVVKVKQGNDLVDYVLPLQGAGDVQGLNFDTLLTGGNLKADILLVIDNSGSMTEKQTSLSAGFPSFISYANSVGLDYQLGVTTSDMGAEGGRLVGTPKILTSSMTGLNALFSQRVQIGTAGSSTEELLAPALAAVTAPLVSTDNAGFLRSGATLGIVSVSDADDQSPQTVSYYVSQLSNVKPPGQVTFSAIAPLAPTSPVATCSYDGPGGAARTVAAVTALGGLAKEICTPDWSQGLLDLGPSVFGAVFGAASFVLANVPDLTAGKTITVKVNGVVVPPLSGTGATVWSYDAMANRVVFAPGYAPSPGEAVTATYFVACIP